MFSATNHLLFWHPLGLILGCLSGMVDKIQKPKIDLKQTSDFDSFRFVLINIGLFPLLFFIFPYYKYQGGNLHGKGIADFFFIFNLAYVMFTFQKAARRWILYPLACHFSDDHKIRHNIVEQFVLGIYYTCSSLLGLYTAYTSSFLSNTASLWVDYPVVAINTLTKFFYLVQASFWISDFCLLVSTEKSLRRKDHWQMISHHIVTIILILGSYIMHFTNVGVVVLLVMDPADSFLSWAKTFKYASSKYPYLKYFCDFFFLAFTITWIITRHYLYITLILKSIYLEAYPILDNKNSCHPFGSWGEFGVGPPASFGCDKFVSVFFALLLFLQVLMINWLYYLVLSLIRVFKGENNEDTRE